MKMNKALALAIKSSPKTVIETILANSNDNEVFTNEELVEISGLTYVQVKDGAGKLIKNTNGFASLKVGNRSFYGRTVAIEKLKEGLFGKNKRRN